MLDKKITRRRFSKLTGLVGLAACLPVDLLWIELLEGYPETIAELIRRLKEEYPPLFDFETKGKSAKIGIPYEFGMGWKEFSHPQLARKQAIQTFYKTVKKKLKKGDSLVWRVKPEFDKEINYKTNKERNRFYARFMIFR